MHLSGLTDKTSVRKIGDLRFKSRLGHKFFLSKIIIYMAIDTQNFQYCYHLLPNVWLDKFISCEYRVPHSGSITLGEDIVTWTQEKTMTLGGTEPLHSSGQRKESHRYCHGLLMPLAMEDSGTSTVLTLYESLRLLSPRQSERTTAKDPVQPKKCAYSCYRAVSTEYQQRWTL